MGSSSLLIERLSMKNTRKKAWKSASGTINSASELWKLGRLTFNWESAGTLVINGGRSFSLIDLDADSQTLSFKVANKDGAKAELDKLFKRTAVDGTSVVISLTLLNLDLLFDNGTFQLWAADGNEVAEGSELHLTFAPIHPVKLKGQTVVKCRR